MKQAGSLLRTTLELAIGEIEPGVRAIDIDKKVGKFLRRNGAVSTSRLRGHPFDINISVNNEVVQGVPTKRKFEEGDLITLDLALFLDGVCVDKAKSFTLDPSIYPKRYVVKSAEKCMNAAISNIHTGTRTAEIGRRIKETARLQKVAVGYEFSGHGIGKDHHMLPLIPNFDDGTNSVIDVWTYFTIEPVVFYADKYELTIDDNFVVTSDCLGAHVEETMVMTPDGLEVLT